MPTNNDPKEILFKIFGFLLLGFLTIVIIMAIFDSPDEKETERLDKATYERMNKAYERGELDRQEGSQFDSLPY